MHYSKQYHGLDNARKLTLPLNSILPIVSNKHFNGGPSNRDPSIKTLPELLTHNPVAKSTTNIHTAQPQAENNRPVDQTSS